jgi:hypothetical protein
LVFKQINIFYCGYEYKFGRRAALLTEQHSRSLKFFRNKSNKKKDTNGRTDEADWADLYGFFFVIP